MALFNRQSAQFYCLPFSQITHPDYSPEIMPAAARLIFLYSYSDPLLEPAPDISAWGWKCDRIYQDQGARSQLQQLLQDCALESRQTEISLRLRQLAELGDSLNAISDCLAQLSQLNVRLLLGELAQPSELIPPAELVQQLDQLQTQRRSIQRGHARNRLNSLPPPGRAPYGYRRGKDRYLLDRSTAPVVKDFFEHFLLYGSLRGSLRHLQKKYGKKISATTGRQWLTSPAYRGDLSYRDGGSARDTHAPILSRQEAAQIDRLLRRNRRLPPRSASAPRSLAGLVRCGVCQSAMKISRSLHRQPGQPPDQRREYLYLRPVACNSACGRCRAIPYAEVLMRTIERICQDLQPAVAQVEQQVGLPNLVSMKAEITAQIAAQQSQLAQLPALVKTEVLDAETAALRAYKLRTTLAQLQTQLAQLPPVNLEATAETVSIRQFWLDLSEAERRFYFREFIQQIQICRTGPDWTLRLIFNFQSNLPQM